MTKWLRFIALASAAGVSSAGTAEGAASTAPLPLKTVSAASLREGVVAPEMVLISQVAGLAPKTVSGSPESPEITLGGVYVKVVDSGGNEGYARIFSVSPSEVKWLFPDWSVNGKAAVTIIHESGTTAEGQVEVASVSPGLFSANGNGQGVAAANAVREAPDGSREPQFAYRCGTIQNSCASLHLDPGSEGVLFVSLFATGIRRAQETTAVIDGETAAIAAVQPQAQAAGVDEVVMRIPASMASRGELGVSISANGVESQTLVLAFGPSKLKVTSIEPGSANAGRSKAEVRFTGEGLEEVERLVFFPPDGITVSDVRPAATEVLATLTLASRAAAGERLAALSSATGRSNPVVFTVVSAVPRITRISHPSLSPGQTVGEFTIEGENLSGAVSILVEPSVAAASLFFSNLVASGSALKAALIVHGRALEGEFSLKVSTAGGVSNSMPIAIRNAPVIDLLHWPISVRGVRIANFTISGRYLSRVTNLEFVPPDGITVANVKSTATAVTADVTISSTAVFGPRRVILRTPADESNWMVFTVSEPKVALSNLTVKFHNSWNLEANADLEDASGASNSYSYLLSVKTSGPGAVSVVRMGSALAAGAGATGSDSRSSGKLTIWISGNANTQGLYIPWGGEYEVTLRVNNMSGVASNSISVKGRYPF